MAKFSLTISIFLFSLGHCIQSLQQNESPVGSHNDAELPKLENLGKETAVKYQTNVLLFGALGDLARKYLWQGFFNLYLSRYSSAEKGQRLRIYGAGRTDEVKGGTTLSHFMEQAAFCDRTIDLCKSDISSFQDILSYTKVKFDDDYRALSEKIDEDLATSFVNESLRIIYLSVPPFAYPTILSLASKYLIPNGKMAKLRIVFEKPFGHDKQSSLELHNLIMKYFKEEEIYRIDHYLGKVAVGEILNFRKKNKDTLQYIWNDEFIESIEIVMKEQVDCKGRTEYYDEYGVILDVMQNHMTEVLARLVMDVPQNDSTSEFTRLKLKALQNVESPSEDDAVLGQYAMYASHIAEEKKAKSLENSNDDQLVSVVPTFAAVKISCKSENLGKTKLFFISGKKLNEKSGYIRINFKSLYQHKVSQFANHKNSDEYYITFYIHSSYHNGPAIQISQGLKNLNFKFSSQWEHVGTNEEFLLMPKVLVDAYTFLIEKIDDGEKSFFVDIDSLLQSWRIWDPIQQLIKAGNLPITQYGINKGDMDFYLDYKTNKLKFKNYQQQVIAQSNNIFTPDQNFDFSALHYDTYLGERLVKGDHKSVVKTLAVSIVNGINDAERKNNTFHVAFPGGSSILPLFRELCFMRHLFRHRHVHVWVVDDRCVPLTSPKSNFKLLLDKLQHCINLPYQNLHPLPVGIGKNKCKRENTVSFAEEMTSWIPTMKLDFVILGVGEDGHVASLFPGDHGSQQSSDWIIVNHYGPKNNVSHRISMSFRLINSANNVALLATGAKKYKIIEKLKRQGQSKDGSLPVMMVRPMKGTLTWYIDNTAFER